MRYAKLRTCASCEWIFISEKPKSEMCPKCGFAHYGARWVYGSIAYRYKHTQEPWIQKKINKYANTLYLEIKDCNSKN